MEKIKQLVDESTAHGFAKIMNNKRLSIKLLWLVFTIISIGALIYFLYRSIVGFLNYDIITNIRVYNIKNPEFPTLSFCIYDDEEDEKSTINETIIFCEFDQIKCNLSEFEKYRSNFNNETCFRFNSIQDDIEIKNVSRSDLRNGLNMFLYSKKYFKETFFKVAIFIHNKTNWFTREQVYNIDSGIMVPVGSTFIKIEREFISNLDKPFSDCVKENTKENQSSIFQEFIKYNLTYTQKDCINLCVQDFIYKSCNCTISLEEEDYSKCYSNTTIGSCLYKLENDDFQKGNASIPDICLDSCPIECDYIYYKTLPFYTPTLPNKYEMLKNQLDELNISEDEFKQYAVYISVNYNSLDYTKIEQIPKSELFDLISNIGGTLGLFIGVSFLSLVEIIEIIFELIKFLIKKLINKFRYN